MCTSHGTPWTPGAKRAAPWCTIPPRTPYHRVDCRPGHRGLRVTLNGATLVDTAESTVLFETAWHRGCTSTPRSGTHRPAAPLGHHRLLQLQGHATYWSAVIGDTVIEDIAWSYETPLPESAPIAGFLSFDETRTEVLAELPGGSHGDCGCST